MPATVSLLYTSAALDEPTVDALRALVVDAQRNNARSGITGVLLSYAGRFVQVLEGPRDAVDACFARIGADARHRDVVKLAEQEIAQRRFGIWSMRDVRISQGADRAVQAFFDELVHRPSAGHIDHALELLQRLAAAQPQGTAPAAAS